MQANSLIDLFGQETGVPLALGETGTVALVFEAGPTVQIEHDPDLDVLHCYVVLGQFPADSERRAALTRLMLQANAFCRDTVGATLGMDADEIILSRRLELARADTEWLRATVESLIAVANEWSAKLGGSFSEPKESVNAFNMPDLNARA